MNIPEPSLKYKGSMPFAATLCRIGNQYPHRHPTELEIVYCLEGSVNLIAADQNYTLTPGQIHSVDFYDVHFLNGSEDNLSLIFHLDLSALPEWDELQYVYYACESNHCFPYQQNAINQVKDIILALSFVYFSGQDPDSSSHRAVRKLADLLLQYFNWFNYENQDEYMNEDLYARFTRILEYIIDNYKEKITVSQLAGMEHMNRSYFSQFISKTVFNSFSNMVNYVRCYNAETLLLTTDKSISDISFECGFSDPKYFYSAFKTLWHLTPTEHRGLYENQCRLALDKENSDTALSDNVASDMLKDYITGWHMDKCLKG